MFGCCPACDRLTLDGGILPARFLCRGWTAGSPTLRNAGAGWAGVDAMLTTNEADVPA